MQQDVSIAMPFQTTIVRNGHAAQDERPAGHQRMNIITHAYAQHGGRMSPAFP